MHCKAEGHRLCMCQGIFQLTYIHHMHRPPTIEIKQLMILLKVSKRPSIVNPNSTDIYHQVYNNHVGRTWLLEFPWKKGSPCWMYYASNAYISAFTGTLAFKRTYLQYNLLTIEKVSWITRMCQRHWQGVKLASGKIMNCSYSFRTSLILDRLVMVVDTKL